MKLLLSALCLAAVSLAAQSPSTAQRLGLLRSAYEAAFQKEVAASHRQSVADLDAKYTSALDRALSQATQAGQLETALALRDEKKRIADAAALPADDFAAPETLKTLRLTYRSALASLEARREQLAGPVKAKYDGALEALQNELTRAGDLDSALAVRSVREALKAGGTPAAMPEAKVAEQKPQQAPSSSGGMIRAAQEEDLEAAMKLVRHALAGGPALILVQPRGKKDLMEIRKMEDLPEKGWTLHTLNASGYNLDAPDLFPWELLPRVPGLVLLGVNQKQPLMPEHAVHLAALPALNRIDMGNMPFTLEALRVLPVIEGMTNLKLGKTEDDPAKVLQVVGEKFPGLPILNIGFEVPAELIPGPGHPLFSLKEFSLKGRLDAAIMAKLAGMPDLKAFETKDCREDSLPPGLLLPLKHYSYLRIVRCKALADIAPSLTKFDSLDFLVISISSTDPLPQEVLGHLADVKSRRLELDGGAGKLLGDEHLDAISQIKGVKEMRLVGHRITPEGKARLRRALPACKLTL